MKLWNIIGISSGGVLLVGYVVYLMLTGKIKKSTRENTMSVDAQLDFASNAEAFSGLFEPLYKIATGDGKFRTGVFGDWATRTENLENAPSYIEYWQAGFNDFSNWTQEEGHQKAETLLSFIMQAGICRSVETDVTIDSSTYKKYDYDDEMIEEGNIAYVKIPYWYYDDTILEKGVLQTMKGETDNGGFH